MEFLIKDLNKSVVLLIRRVDGTVDASVAVLDVEIDGEGDGADRVLEVRLRDGRVVNKDCRTRTKLPRHTTVRSLLITQHDIVVRFILRFILRREL